MRRLSSGQPSSVSMWVLWLLHVAYRQLNVLREGPGSKCSGPRNRKWKLPAVGLESGTAPLPPYSVSQSSHRIPSHSMGGDRDVTSLGKNVKNFVAIFNLPCVPFSLKFTSVLYFAFVSLSLSSPTLSKHELGYPCLGCRGVERRLSLRGRQESKGTGIEREVTRRP